MNSRKVEMYLVVSHWDIMSPNQSGGSGSAENRQSRFLCKSFRAAKRKKLSYREKLFSKNFSARRLVYEQTARGFAKKSSGRFTTGFSALLKTDINPSRTTYTWQLLPRVPSWIAQTCGTPYKAPNEEIRSGHESELLCLIYERRGVDGHIHYTLHHALDWGHACRVYDQWGIGFRELSFKFRV